MALKIRLRQQGRRNRHTYRLVLADSRYPRDGKYLEMLGWYDPYAEGEKNLSIHEERISYWLEQGAVLSEKSKALVSKKAPGVIKTLHEKKVKKQLKLNAKRRASKKKAK